MNPVVGTSYLQTNPVEPVISTRSEQAEILKRTKKRVSFAPFPEILTPTTRMDAQVKQEVQPQLPKSISLGVLDRLNPPMDAPIGVATRKEIQRAVDERSFFELQNLLDQTIEAERVSGIYDCALRDAFSNGFSILKKSSMLQGKHEQQELMLFIREGRGAESLRVYSKIRLNFLEVDDPMYHVKIKRLAQKIVRLECSDRIPGTNRRLGEITKKQYMNIPLTESLFIDARKRRQQGYKEKAFKTLQTVSVSLVQCQDKELALRTMTTLRGMTHSEKGPFLKKLGMDPRTLPILDSIELEMGGPLTHYESLALLRELREMLETSKHPFLEVRET